MDIVYFPGLQCAARLFLGPGSLLCGKGSMNGIVAVNKPADVTSAQVVARVKKALKAKKAGHTGTLDPFATGVLICCLDQATRLAQFLSKSRKSYEAVLRLGVRTDTQDLTGRVMSEASISAITDKEIKSVFQRFIKVKEQVPPAFSALKHRGEPLYKLARKGVFVKKPPRRIAIYHLELLDVSLPFVRFEVVCSSGTYIRTLSDDLGMALGCGAHLVELCRTDCGGVTLAETIGLSTLEDLAAKGQGSRCILPMNEALKGVPEVRADESLVRKVGCGVPISECELGGVAGRQGTSWIKVTDADRNLIAVLGSEVKNGVVPYMCVFA
jgi:tRNA pseudouridine55 synthase